MKNHATTIGLVLLYGLAMRLLYASDILGNSLLIVSWSFILVMPFGFGALTTFLGYKLCGPSKYWAYGAPFVVITFGMLLSIITDLEAILCVVVAAPVMIIPAMLGGIIMKAILSRGSGRLQVSFLVLLPLATSPIESQWAQPHEQVSIQDSIEIAVAPEELWKHIASVPAIGRDEVPNQWIYALDFPRPISAEVDFHGLGGKRRATFEREVSFFETITEWQPPHRLSFSIEADPEFIPHTAFDQHIIIGGRFYDVLDGTYEIEPTATGSRLILISNHRLATPFNRYAGWWSEWVMHQIQGSILSVIKRRAEGESPAAAESPL